MQISKLLKGEALKVLRLMHNIDGFVDNLLDIDPIIFNIFFIRYNRLFQIA